jgi:hypothetical protein
MFTACSLNVRDMFKSRVFGSDRVRSYDVWNPSDTRIGLTSYALLETTFGNQNPGVKPGQVAWKVQEKGSLSDKGQPRHHLQ